MKWVAAAALISKITATGLKTFGQASRLMNTASTPHSHTPMPSMKRRPRQPFTSGSAHSCCQSATLHTVASHRASKPISAGMRQPGSC